MGSTEGSEWVELGTGEGELKGTLDGRMEKGGRAGIYGRREKAAGLGHTHLLRSGGL
jgi:hypothetical protein